VVTWASSEAGSAEPIAAARRQRRRPRKETDEGNMGVEGDMREKNGAALAHGAPRDGPKTVRPQKWGIATGKNFFEGPSVRTRSAG
jgi:hypothetical protein